MRKISGLEASILAYYAQYAELIERGNENLEDRLGVEARKILKEMRKIWRGKKIKKSVSGMSAQAIWDWANKKTE